MTSRPLGRDGQIHVVFDLADAEATGPFVRALQSLPDGRACCTITADCRNLYTVAGDLLAGMLKRRVGLAGSPRHGQDRFQSAIAWLTGERIGNLFIDRAHQLYSQAWSTLCSLAPAYGVDVWLITTEGLPRHRKDHLRGWGAQVLEIDEFRVRWDAAATAPAADAAYPSVPRDDWTTFAHACQTLLGRDEFRLVQSTLQAAAASTEQWLDRAPPLTGPDAEEHVAGFLRTLVQSAHRGHEAVVRLRAAQQVLFEDAGVNVKVSPTPFLDAIQEARLTEQTADVLRSYTSTRHAALALLQLALPAAPADLIALSVGDVASSGEHVHLRSDQRTIPGYGAGILRAHLAARRMQAASDADPLFVYETRAGLQRMTPRAVQQTLTTVGRETGLRLTNHWNEHALTSQRGWLWRRGVSIQQLHPPA